MAIQATGPRPAGLPVFADVLRPTGFLFHRLLSPTRRNLAALPTIEREREKETHTIAVNTYSFERGELVCS